METKKKDVKTWSPEILSKELLVAREILLVEKSGHGPVYFNQLVSRLEGIASRATISSALDMLFDQGIVKAEWTNRTDGRHVRALSIAGEARSFVEVICKRTSRA